MRARAQKRLYLYHRVTRCSKKEAPFSWCSQRSIISSKIPLKISQNLDVYQIWKTNLKEFEKRLGTTMISITTEVLSKVEKQFQIIATEINTLKKESYQNLKERKENTSARPTKEGMIDILRANTAGIIIQQGMTVGESRLVTRIKLIRSAYFQIWNHPGSQTNSKSHFVHVRGVKDCNTAVRTVFNMASQMPHLSVGADPRRIALNNGVILDSSRLAREGRMLKLGSGKNLTITLSLIHISEPTSQADFA